MVFSTSRGFSLLELILVLLIATLLASLSAPGLGRMLQRQQGDAAINELARTFSFARSAAVARSHVVTLCGSSDSTRCNGAWEVGLLVFADLDADGVVDVGEPLLKQTSLKANGGSMQLRSFPRKLTVQFDALGFTYKKQNGSLIWCAASRDPHLAQQLIFIRTGRARLARDSDGDGIREGADGRPIVC
jgi:type IV fimbrial biogenesis protein FimT